MMVVLPLPKKPDRTVTAETDAQAEHSGGTRMNQGWDSGGGESAAHSASDPVHAASCLSMAVQSSAVGCMRLLLTLREWSLCGAIVGGGLRHGERGMGG